MRLPMRIIWMLPRVVQRWVGKRRIANLIKNTKFTYYALPPGWDDVENDSSEIKQEY